QALAQADRQIFHSWSGLRRVGHEVRMLQISRMPPDSTRPGSLLASDRAVRMTLRETVRSLDIAAKSIVETQALGGTVAGVIAERALDHHWQGLFQYVAIRIGTDAAAKLLDQLVHDVEGELRDKLDTAPGPQANLYRRVR